MDANRFDHMAKLLARTPSFRTLARTRSASLPPPRERGTRPLPSLLPLVAFAFFADFATFITADSAAVGLAPKRRDHPSSA